MRILNRDDLVIRPDFTHAGLSSLRLRAETHMGTPLLLRRALHRLTHWGSLTMERLRGQRLGLAGLVASLVILASLPALMPGTQAATFLFPVQSEQVVTGTTTGLSGAQTDDGIGEGLSESDTASDTITVPVNQTLPTGAIVGGVFPAGIASEDGTFVQYR